MKKFNSNIKERLTGRHKKCFQFCGNLKGKTILNIGCSFGWFEKMAIDAKCKKIIGIEPEKKLLYFAKKEIPKAKFKIGSVLNIPAKDNTFDVVTMFDVLEHLPKGSEVKAFREIERVLKKNGLFVMSTPFNFWLSNIMDPAWYFGHRHYSQRKLTNLFKETRFKFEKIEFGGRIYELVSMILFYIFKWFFRSEIPFKGWFERKREKEYFSLPKGFVTIFLKFKKIKNE